MAFGLPPKYKDRLEMDGLDPEQFIAIAVKIAQSFGWRCSYITKDGFVAYTQFSIRSYSEEIRFYIEENEIIITSQCNGIQWFDLNKNKSNIKKFKIHFEAFLSVLNEKTQIAINQFAQETILPSEEESIFSLPPTTFRNKIEDFISLFVPTNGYTVIPLIADLNILMFILLTISGTDFFLSNSQTLFDWGANSKIEVNNGQYWRLITSLILHAGFFHLLMNTWVMIYIGLLLEPFLGKSKTFFLYLISGIVASLTSHFCRSVPLSVGASGAIFGLVGGFLALLLSHKFDKHARRAYLIAISIFVGYNLLSVFSKNSNTDNAAHIGGLISGFIIGLLYLPDLKTEEDSSKLKWMYGTLVTLFFVGVITILYYKNKNSDNFATTEDLVNYSAKINEFRTTKNMALKVYDLPEDATEEEYKNNLKDIGIYFWKEDLQLLEDMKTIKVPKFVKKYNDSLYSYCQLRLMDFELMYKSVDENTEKYDRKISYLDSIIEIKEKELYNMETYIQQNY